MTDVPNREPPTWFLVIFFSLVMHPVAAFSAVFVLLVGLLQVCFWVFGIPFWPTLPWFLAFYLFCTTMLYRALYEAARHAQCISSTS